MQWVKLVEWEGVEEEVGRVGLESSSKRLDPVVCFIKKLHIKSQIFIKL